MLSAERNSYSAISKAKKAARATSPLAKSTQRLASPTPPRESGRSQGSYAQTSRRTGRTEEH